MMWSVKGPILIVLMHQITISIMAFSIKKEWLTKLFPSSNLEFEPNGTLKIRSPIFSCLEDESYKSANDYVNCHLFCPSCGQGFGKCVSARDLKMCVCDCQFPVQLHKECSTIQKYCRSEIRSDADKEMIRCKEACEVQGFSDGSLCGLDDPPFSRPTCTCLCPKLSLQNNVE